MAWLGETDEIEVRVIAPWTFGPGIAIPIMSAGFTAWRELFIDIDFPTFRVRARPYDHAWDGA